MVGANDATHAFCLCLSFARMVLDGQVCRAKLQICRTSMKDLDWNDLRYILYLSRTGRIASTAKMLRVNETTVARRIAHVERLLGARLFERSAGVLVPTDSGQLVINRAERI